MIKKPKKKVLSHILNVVTIAVIVEAFLCAMMAVRMYARDNCLESLEETTVQVAETFRRRMEQNKEQLTLFSNILASNSANPDSILQQYMKHFCETQAFSAVCIHKKDGTSIYYGPHPHELSQFPDYETELKKLPYTSGIIRTGDRLSEQYVYQAVTIERKGVNVAVLYGYISLDTIKDFVFSTAYYGNASYFAVDGDTGEYLLNELHRYDENGEEVDIGNFFESGITGHESKKGYDLSKMLEDIRRGQIGTYVFKSKNTGEWYYMGYTPVGINNWSVHVTVDEDTAFAGFSEVSITVMILMVTVVVMMIVHVSVLMIQDAQIRARDKAVLRKSRYINKVQSALINAHTNPDFVDQALKIVGEEMKAETVLLLAFKGKVISNAQYWPSTDRAQAQALLGLNIRDEFPELYDQLASNNAAAFEYGNLVNLPVSAQALFADLDVRNILLVPIMDNAGKLKGSLAAVNVADMSRGTEMLECVTYDFFMTITNLENHMIIKRMGSMDYLTGVKNRNCFEADIEEYTNIKAKTLWCVFIDVNGLHDVNNKEGHKAGDKMLVAVADAVKKVFGDRHTYRLGGDEFVSFMTDSSHEEFMGRKYKITEQLAKLGYYVSVGFDGVEKENSGKFDVDKAMSRAEAIMYRDKWEYYQKHNIPTERGHFPVLESNEE